MCKLCDRIYNKEEWEQWFSESRHIIALIENKYYFYTEISDYYYTPETRFEINYCPSCGRKLAED